MERNLFVSFSRVMAMLFIIACHFCAHLGNNMLSEVFQIGVFIFFFISGYLYGDKKIDDYKLWFLNRVKRIFIPLYLYILLNICLHGGITINKTLIFQLFNLQGLFMIFQKMSLIDGPWFFTVIMICYILLIFIKKEEDKLDKYSTYGILILLVILFILFKFININISGLVLFLLGYLSKRRKLINIDKINIFVIYSIVFIACYIVRLLLHSMINNTFAYNQVIVPILNMIITFTLMAIWNYMVNNISWLKSIIKSKGFILVDKVSIYVYLIHGYFINDSFIFENNIGTVLVSFILIVVLSIAASFVLFSIGKVIEMVFIKLNKKQG